MKHRPKVLVVAHNAFAKTTNMGKTLASYFELWNPEDVAELYFHSEIPTSDVCQCYYRITDVDALKSILFRYDCGKRILEQDICIEKDDPRRETNTLARIYRLGRRRMPLSYILRNFVWACSAWYSKDLDEWLDSFSPEAVFFASGDYSFSYQVALKISRLRHIPLIVCCVDDYYCHNRNGASWLGRWQHLRFMKTVAATMAQASCIMTINDKMSREYAALFQKECYTLYTGAKQNVAPLSESEKTGISYLGNLSLNRNKQLVAIGRTLKKMSSPEAMQYLDVYSGEKDPELLKELTPENGIIFRGAVSADKVSEVIAKSLVVIHTEAFDDESKWRVMYSTSTKIAESLASGTCLVAYGPAEVASMEYLIENNAAVVITAPEQLEAKLTQVLTDVDLRRRIVKNALLLAEKNHQPKAVSHVIKTALQRACEKGIK